MNVAIASDTVKKIESRSLHGMDFSADYYFYEISLSQRAKYYAVEIVESDEGELAVIGRDKVKAFAFYGKMVDMEVCACTLQDIVYDNFQDTKY